MPETKDLRYIVFLLNPEVDQYMPDGRKIDTSEGYVFKSKNSAIDYAKESVQNYDHTRFAIGVFVWNELDEQMIISSIETYGFKKDKKNIQQLSFF